MSNIRQILVVVLGRNWKTSLSGIVMGWASFTLFEPYVQDKPMQFRIAAWLVSGGGMLLGITAKDWNVTSKK